MPGYIAWLRQHVGPELIPVVYATGLVRDEAGRILFQRRADFDWWGLPGGVLEPHETLAACVRRETCEETGLRVEPVRLTGVYSSPRYNVTYPNGDRVQQITFCVDCRIVGGELKADGDEILDVGFFPTVDLPPRPIWYSDMVDHVLGGAPLPYFDPPDHQPTSTRFPNLAALRTVIGSEPCIAAGASAAVFDEAGRILLHRRSDDGEWGLPAGALDVGDTLSQTAVRETFEETGLSVEPTRVIGAYAGYEIEYPNGDRLLPAGVMFACRILGGELRADGIESLEVGFFDRDHLPPLTPRWQARVRAALTGGPRSGLL